MIKALHAAVVGVLLCALAPAQQPASQGPAPDPRAAHETQPLLREDDGRGTDYVVDKTDNICGLDTPRQLTNPALVDYDALLDATPEIRQMKREKISESSARGIQLRSAAEERVRKACQKIMDQEGHCSVWKVIKRRDGRKLPDITDLVKSEL